MMWRGLVWLKPRPRVGLPIRCCSVSINLSRNISTDMKTSMKNNLQSSEKPSSLLTPDPSTMSSNPSGLSSDPSSKTIYKRLTHPTLVPLLKLFLLQFPYSILDLIKDYSYRDNPLVFQENLLQLLPFYPLPDSSGRHSKVLKVDIGNGNYINEFVIYPPGKTDKDSSSMNHLVMIHGYGGGLGFWLKNFDQISAHPLQNWCVHSIDLLGYGCLSRPPFEHESLEDVEAWFHDSYATWHAKRLGSVPKDQILVAAHSMGAYLMVSYGIKKDPEFCRKIIMISPGAVIKHQKEVVVPEYFKRLWERNISPFVLVRKAGPLGSKVVSMWSLRRFAKLPEEEALRLHQYAYGIFQLPGLGEYMLNCLLAPGADARHPLVERGIDKLRCNFLWVYGREDWMDIEGGRLCSEIITAQGYESDVIEIPDSGHHIYLDNIEAFNLMITKEMDKMEGSDNI